MIHWKYLVILCGIGFWGCKKSDTGQVPYVPVDVSIFTTDPTYSNLTVVGGWEYITGGSQGIVVYRKTTTEFIAMDRHCPYQIDENCRVKVNDSNILLEDECCGSVYILQDGSISNGPTESPLLQYNTSFDGNILRITN